MMHYDWQSGFFTVMGWTGLSYALQTFPMPASKYGKWFLGSLQFIVANAKLGQQNFAAASQDQAWDNKVQVIKDHLEEPNPSPVLIIPTPNKTEPDSK